MLKKVVAMDELSPIVRSLTDQPLGFLSGFVAGVFRMNPMEDPVKSWLTEQLNRSETGYGTAGGGFTSTNGNNKGPQSISIE
ncbi:gsl4024 [Gloeobacter violaceus PCC 7421]|uniref:Gsl4024 protein n=2 Tax=Gloeobacter violaceus TaxID=33072 RepID=Q7NE56_GLOVI|nr:gsl4024 [Gloeobacter violaceus PCC 7421]